MQFRYQAIIFCCAVLEPNNNVFFFILLSLFLITHLLTFFPPMWVTDTKLCMSDDLKAIDKNVFLYFSVRLRSQTGREKIRQMHVKKTTRILRNKF